MFWTESGADPDGESLNIAADPTRWGDVVIARKDTPTSYHLSVVVDDALQGVTHVVRGRDLFHATSVHRLLQKLLGLPEPNYHHHDLVLGDDGLKLSKSRRIRRSCPCANRVLRPMTFAPGSSSEMIFAAASQMMCRTAN